jgi:hypothetical protein
MINWLTDSLVKGCHLGRVALIAKLIILFASPTKIELN